MKRREVAAVAELPEEVVEALREAAAQVDMTPGKLVVGAVVYLLRDLAREQTEDAQRLRAALEHALAGGKKSEGSREVATMPEHEIELTATLSDRQRERVGEYAARKNVEPEEVVETILRTGLRWFMDATERGEEPR